MRDSPTCGRNRDSQVIAHKQCMEAYPPLYLYKHTAGLTVHHPPESKECKKQRVRDAEDGKMDGGA